MGWFTNLEKNIAGKLAVAFGDAKKLAKTAGHEVEAAEVALTHAREKAAGLSKLAHEAALAAVEKAKAETEALIKEAEEAAKQAEYHAGKLTVEPILPVTMPTCGMCKSTPCICEHPQ
jgi:F0F1-type ATP synthase membrane subunit b/b'